MALLKELITEGRLKENSDIVSKGIYTEDKRSSSILSLDALNSDDTLIPLTWKEWKMLPVKDTSSDYVKKEFIKSLVGQLKGYFQKQIDFNMFARKGASFEEKVDWLLNNGAKYNKRGIKAKY